MKSKIALSFAGLLWISGASNAANWVEIAKDDSTLVEVDVQSLTVLKNADRKVWGRFTYTPPQAIGLERVAQIVQLSLIRCDERTLGMLQKHVYNEGATSASRSVVVPIADVKFEEVIPGSFGDTIVSQICAQPLRRPSAKR